MSQALGFQPKEAYTCIQKLVNQRSWCQLIEWVKHVRNDKTAGGKTSTGGIKIKDCDRYIDLLKIAPLEKQISQRKKGKKVVFNMLSLTLPLSITSRGVMG